MRFSYSIEPKDWIYLKGHGFLSFAKNMGKDLVNKYGQKPLDSAKKSTTEEIKITSKRAIHKTAEATGGLIDNKIADKITSVSIKSPKKLHSQNEDEIEIPKERYTSSEKKDNKLLMN